MRLLSINQARAIWLFPLSDLNPRGRASERNGLLEIGRRYSFAQSPTAIDLVAAREKGQAISYKGGAFKPRKKDEVAVDLSIYRDGMIADTRSSTADSAEFLDDLLTWASQEFGLLPHEAIVKTKLSLSEVHVTTDKELAVLNPKLTAFAKTLGAKVPGHSGIQFDLSAVGFWPTSDATSKPVNFRFERAEGHPFEQKRYFSIAPFETETHLELLDKLEAILG